MSRPTPIFLAVLAAVILLSPIPLRADEPAFLAVGQAEWVRKLKDPQPSVRRSAAFALGKMGESSFGYIPNLLRVLQTDDDPGVREAAAFAIGEIGPTQLRAADGKYVIHGDDPSAGAKGTLTTLTENLTHSDARVRRSSAFALGKVIGFLGASTAPNLQQALQDRDPGVRQNAAFALGEMGQYAGKEAIPALCQLVSNDGDALVRRDAARALGKIGRGNSQAVPVLLKRFQDGREELVVRRTALEALVEVVGPDDRDAATEFRALLKNPDPDLSRNAALGLANIGGKDAVEAVPMLRKLMHPDEDPAVRRLAVAGLANIGSFASDAITDLNRALGDTDVMIRRAAALGLGQIGSRAKEAIPNLVKMLGDSSEDEEARKYAAGALAMIDPNNDDVVATMVRVLGEKGVYPVRHRAVWALERLRPFERPGVVDALTNLLSESGDAAKLLRYEAAKVLALGLGDRTPDKALEVLLAALQDERVFIFTGDKVKVGAGGREVKPGEADIKSSGAGDWRRIVAGAVVRVGKAKAGTPEIIEALKKMSTTSPDLKARDAALAALKELE